jgi:hypothetical protein
MSWNTVGKWLKGRETVMDIEIAPEDLEAYMKRWALAISKRPSQRLRSMILTAWAGMKCARASLGWRVKLPWMHIRAKKFSSGRGIHSNLRPDPPSAGTCGSR